MNAINELKLLGHVGNDPELRSTDSGRMVAHFRVATNEEYTKRSTGERKRHTEWHHIEVWGRLAEQCANHLQKGSQVIVDGKIRTHKYVNNEGQTVYDKRVLANRVLFLSGIKPRQTAASEPQDE